MVDPDDFIVDAELTSKSVIDGLIDKGVIIKSEVQVASSGGVANTFKSRDMTADDSAFCEYFFTVEPYEQQINN